MSNYHSYHCLDCHASHKPSNLNHGHRQMCAVLRFKKELAAVAPLGAELWWFELKISDGHCVPFDFIVAHQEHHLVVLSEYHDRYYEPDETPVVAEVPWVQYTQDDG